MAQDFDLEFFMRSTDVGLYNVAREIFSHLGSKDLVNLMKIGKTNKTFDEFLKNEKAFLWEKFEKVTLKVLKNLTGRFIGPGGQKLRLLREAFGVAVWIDSKKPGRFTFVTITGEVECISSAIRCIPKIFV